MFNRRKFLANLSLGAFAALCGRKALAATPLAVTHTDAEWRKLLTADQYAVLRDAGTERPFTSPLLHEERKGVFACAGCDLDLFSSDDQIRQRHRLAELLGAARRRRGRRATTAAMA